MSVCVYANSSDGGSEEKGKLELVEQFPRFLDRWNTNEEAAKYLVSVEYHQDWVSKEPAERPASGQMFIYDKREVKYKKDGYAWKRRKDGRTPREDHMRLKVFGVELLYGCYAHSADNATFHRRSYWLLQKPDTVLVHYLDVPSNADKSLNGISDTELLQLVMSKPCLMDKLRSQLQPLPISPRNGENISPKATPPVLHTPPSRQNTQMFSQFASTSPLMQHSPPLLKHSPTAMLHSPPFMHESPILLDPHPFAEPVQPCGVFDDLFRLSDREVASIGSRSSASAPSSPQLFNRQSSLCTDSILRKSWPHLESPPHVRSSPGSVYAQTCGSPTAIEISDFCPDWAYCEGGTKVVVTGLIPEGHTYGLGFGDKFVPATLVQPGVLRCFCPPHDPGLVPLQLFCGNSPIAKSAVFDYKQRENLSSSPCQPFDDCQFTNALNGAPFLEHTANIEQPPLLEFSPGVPSQYDDGMLVQAGFRAPENSLMDSDSAQASAQATWPYTTPPESDSSLQTTVSATSSTTSVGSIFDDPEAPSVAEWCAILGDGRNVLQEDFNRLNLSDGDRQQLFIAASTIQTAFRKYRRKTKDLERQNSAAILIQNWYRRYKVVKKQVEARERIKIQSEQLAALKIQRFLRRSMLLKKKHGNLVPRSRSACSKMALLHRPVPTD